MDSTAQVSGYLPAGIDFDFIQKMQELQAPFDVLTIHPYRSKLVESEFINELKRASDVAVLPGGKRRPVWITEMGWRHIYSSQFMGSGRFSAYPAKGAGRIDSPFLSVLHHSIVPESILV